MIQDNQPLPNMPNKVRKLSNPSPSKHEIHELAQKRKHNALVQGCDSI